MRQRVCEKGASISNTKGFVAYAFRPSQIGECIREAIKLANRTEYDYTGWEEHDIAGRPLTAPIFEGLERNDILVADISVLNFNVIFEIGYAIGVGRRVFLVRNREFASDEELINKIGIFDTLGYQTYETAAELFRLITGVSDLRSISTVVKPNRNAPAYILETPFQGHVQTHIRSRVKKARLFFRSFTPAEDLRLSAVDAVAHVAASFGVIVPLLSPAMTEFETHNFRAAFVSGLSLGMEKTTLILQDQDGPLAPLDVRDLVKSYSSMADISRYIHEFSLSVTEQLQIAKEVSRPAGSKLSALRIGDPTAENEFQTLDSYYLQTDEFNRALRGEINIVVGRKGTGKTALFSQLRNHKRSDKSNIVVDLKPEGYQLVKLKEHILDFLTDGAKQHLITAFWEFLLYSEIAYKVLEKDRERHVRDHTLYKQYVALSEAYKADSEGDFSERLQRLSESITREFLAKYGGATNTRLTTNEVTSFLYTRDIKALKKLLTEYLQKKNEVWLVFDNLDKGWSTQGLTDGDIVILRCLIEASRKVQRDLRRDEIDFHSVVFVRNDVYQLLMDLSPDFGKETRATLDWSDPDLLRAMLQKRLLQNSKDKSATFEDLWASVCISHYQGEETSHFMIERSLMRPRYLLKLFNSCRGFAVNLGHERVNDHDIEKGFHAFSNDLVVDADHELTDIEPQARRLIYQFLGEKSSLTHTELLVLFAENGISEDRNDAVVEFLLYYGFLGVSIHGNEAQYIYDVGYNMEILKTTVSKNRTALSYVLHPSFWPALYINQG